jgi:hypothetical protein
MMEIMKPFFLGLGLLFAAALITSLIYGIGSQEKKCIDGQVHKLVSDEYWRGTGFTCKPLKEFDV